MGGSSLAPEVLRRAFRADGFHVLDTTHPAAIRRLERELDLERTLFVVSSKSGSTLETRSHADYFWERSRRAGRALRRDHRPGLGARAAGDGARVPRDLPRRARDRRPLLGALALRDRPGGADGCRPRALPRSRRRDDGGLRARRRQSRPRARARAGRGLARGPRQGLPRRRSVGLRPVGRAAHRRVDRQGGQGPRARAGRVARRPRPPARRGAAAAIRTSSRRSSCAGSSRPRSRGTCSRSIRSTSRTSRPRRTRRTRCSRAGEPDLSTARLARRAARGRAARATTSSIQAFVDPAREDELAPLVARAHETGCVVTSGLGPRYLHSTGQLHKGGPEHGPLRAGRRRRRRRDRDPGSRLRLRPPDRRAGGRRSRGARGARSPCRPSTIGGGL